MRATLLASLAVLIPVASVLFSSGRAVAEPLDPEQCGKLSAEHKKMIGEGIEAELTKGPEWAVANLGEEGLSRIKHFLTLEEQIRFRCPLIQKAAAKAGPTVPLPLRNPERLVATSKAADVPTVPVRQN